MSFENNDWIKNVVDSMIPKITSAANQEENMEGKGGVMINVISWC